MSWNQVSAVVTEISPGKTPSIPQLTGFLSEESGPGLGQVLNSFLLCAAKDRPSPLCLLSLCSVLCDLQSRRSEHSETLKTSVVVRPSILHMDSAEATSNPICEGQRLVGKYKGYHFAFLQDCSEPQAKSDFDVADLLRGPSKMRMHSWHK